MTLKEMCEQAAREYRSTCGHIHLGADIADCEGCLRVANVIERVAKAFAEKALWQMHGGEAAVMSRSNGSAIYVMEHVKRIADAIAIAAADAPTKT